MKVRLAEVRKRLLVTQEELSQRSGLTEATISRIENGIHAPRISTVRRLAAALNIDPSELVINEERAE